MILINMNETFYEKLKDLSFDPISFTLFNQIDEDDYIRQLEIYDKIKYSINDFECHYLSLTNKEKFLIKMHNKNFLKNIKTLIYYFRLEPRVKIIIDYYTGEVVIIKLKNILITFNESYL